MQETKKIPALICDMDGTLADCGHRLHWVNSKPKNYNAFEAECHKDPVVQPVKDLIEGFLSVGYKILIVSARMDGRKQLTVDWLEKQNIPYAALYMRTQGDSRKDDIVKLELLDRIRKDGYNPTVAVDDRKRVKRMWVEQGIFVFDVNQKDKEY